MKSGTRKILLRSVLPLTLALVFLTGIVLIAVFSAAKYNPAGKGSKFTEDFYYYAYPDEKGGGYVNINGMTPKAKSKTNLILPVAIDSMTVNSVYTSKGCNGRESVIKSDNLQKLYLPQINLYSGTFRECPKLRKLLFYNYTESYLRDLQSINYPQNAVEFYVSGYWRNENDDPVSNIYKSGERGNIYIANVSYMYNYPTDINYGYYFIDDCEYGETIDFTPPDPQREGYTFGGWYRDRQCVSKWDFDSDTLPREYDEYGVALFTETKLYAKWIGK